MNFKFDKKEKISLIIGLFGILLIAIGATYAYFTVTSTNNATTSTITTTAKTIGTPVLNTTTANLYLTLSALNLSKETAGSSGVTYYANSASTGTPLLTNPNYTLATASVATGDATFTCTYSFTVKGSMTTAITDTSDKSTDNIKVNVGGTIKTMTNLIEAGNTGITISGTLVGLKKSTNKTIAVSSTFTNTNLGNQNKMSGNGYSIQIIPKSFSCTISA